MLQIEETIEGKNGIKLDYNSRIQKQRLLNFLLISVLIFLKIFDLTITIFALFFGVNELNPLKFLFTDSPQTIMLISFLPIFIGLLFTLIVKNDLVILKMITYGFLAFISVLFFIILSNLCQLCYML